MKSDICSDTAKKNLHPYSVSAEKHYTDGKMNQNQISTLECLKSYMISALIRFISIMMSLYLGLITTCLKSGKTSTNNTKQFFNQD